MLYVPLLYLHQWNRWCHSQERASIFLLQAHFAMHHLSSQLFPAILRFQQMLSVFPLPGYGRCCCWGSHLHTNCVAQAQFHRTLQAGPRLQCPYSCLLWWHETEIPNASLHAQVHCRGKKMKGCSHRRSRLLKASVAWSPL